MNERDVSHFYRAMHFSRVVNETYDAADDTETRHWRDETDHRDVQKTPRDRLEAETATLHFNAKRGLAIACRPSVRLSDVGDL